MADIIKLLLAILLVCAGVVGFYVIPPEQQFARVAAVVAGVLLGMLAALFSAYGKRFIFFWKESVAETKKVVWPSRKETTQMTLIVFAFVVVVAIFLWLTDKSLEWVLYDLILQWK